MAFLASGSDLGILNNTSQPFNTSDFSRDVARSLPFVTFSWSHFTVVMVFLVSVVIFLFALIGNITVILILSIRRSLKEVVNRSLLISLSFADLLVALLVMPCAMDTVIAGRWRCGSFWNKFNGLGNFCFCICSIMHLMMLAADKYFAILHPFRYKIWITNSRSRKMCVFLWLYSITWAIIPLFGVSSYECFIAYLKHCEEKDWSSNRLNIVFAILVNCCTYGIALMAIFYFYWKIFVTIRAQERQMKSVALKTKQKQFPLISSKGTVTIAILIVCFIVCWSPFCILLFVEIVIGKKLSGSEATITMFLGFANSACNPIIYAIRYRSFKENMVNVFLRSVLHLPTEVLDRNVIPMKQIFKPTKVSPKQIGGENTNAQVSAKLGFQEL